MEKNVRAAVDGLALGLLLVRQRRTDEALGELARADELQPENIRYSYVYAIALNSVGREKEAIQVLERGHERRPDHRDTLIALISIHRERGELDVAVRYAERLVALTPEDPGARRLLDELRSQR